MRPSVRGAVLVGMIDLRLIRADPAYTITFILVPIGVMLLTSEYHQAALDSLVEVELGHAQAVAGSAVLFAFFFVGDLGFSVYRDFEWRTWERLEGACGSPGVYLIGKCLAPTVTLVLQVSVVILIGSATLLRSVDLGRAAFLSISATAYVAAIVGLAALLTVMTSSVRQHAALANLGAFGLGALGGALVPPEALPGPLRVIGAILPSRWALDSLRSCLAGEDGYVDVALSRSALLVLVAGIALWVAVRRFDRFAGLRSL